MVKIRRYNGRDWQDASVRKWSNGSWVQAQIKQWSNGSWGEPVVQKPAKKRYTKTWEATWTRSYGHGGTVLKPDKLGGKNKMYQGRYGQPDSWNYDWGIQKSMVGFDWRNIEKEIINAKVEKIEIYLHNEHFWYFAGGRASIGIHNNGTPPSTFKEVRYGVKNVAYQGRGQAQWIEMPLEFATRFQTNGAGGFTLNRNTSELSYYGYFYGAGAGSKAPKVRITYVK